MFEGVRVLDLSQGFAGPLAGMILADFGADVVKVEPPWGDWARQSPGFKMWNRGKRGLALDLRRSLDRTTLRSLVSESDVLLESFRPGVMARLGIAYDDLASGNPRLVFCSISGFGPASHEAGMSGYEAIVSARMGLMQGLNEVSGAAVGQDRDRPIFKAIPVNSFAAAQLCTMGVVAALIDRSRTGLGQLVETSLLEGAAATIFRIPFKREDGPSSQAGKAQSALNRGVYLCFLTAECSDGKWIQMCARQDQHFRNWLAALGLGEVLQDPRYAGGPMAIPTIADVEALEVRLRHAMRHKTQAEWIRIFIEETDVGADPFLTPSEFLEHPQMTANDRIVQIHDPEVGLTRQLGPIALLSKTPTTIRDAAPSLGEHTAQILQSVGATSRKSSRPNSRPPDGQPLAGFTIVELAYFLAGPFVGTMLAEMGARVIKIEPPDGDPYRRMGLEFVHLSHGKESVAIDLKTDAGRQALYSIIERADGLVHSFRPGVPERLGIDYETVSRINPRLVYLYAASYGSRGPQSHRAAFHSTPHALSGGGILQAGVGNPPVDDGYADPCSGLGAATALMLALFARECKGVGQYVEASMLCTTGYVLSEHLVQYAGRPDWLMPDRLQRGTHACYRLYHCRSGWLFLGVVQDKEWERLAAVLDHPDWTVDPRFKTVDQRLQHDEELSAAISDALASRSASEWQTVLCAANVPGVQADGEKLPDYLLRAGLLTASVDPLFGDYWRLPAKIRFSRSHTRVTAAPSIGEHTGAVLIELGYSQPEIDRLRAQGAIA